MYVLHSLYFNTAIVTVGLVQSSYAIPEGEGVSSFEVCATIMEGTTSEDISLTILAANGSALGELASLNFQERGHS